MECQKTSRFEWTLDDIRIENIILAPIWATKLFLQLSALLDIRHCPKLQSFFIFYNKFFISINQIYKTNSKIKHKKRKTIYKLYTRLYLVIYFSLTYKFGRYHR